MIIYNISVKTMLSMFTQLDNSNIESVNIKVESRSEGDYLGIMVATPSDIPSEGIKLTTEIINKLIV